MDKTAAIFIVISVVAGCASPGNDPAEIDRTWQNASIFYPTQPGRMSVGFISSFSRVKSELKSSRSIPVVLYLHGCSGLGRASFNTGSFLAKAGYLVVMPDSFARKFKPKSCPYYGNFHLDAIDWRTAEATYALKKIRTWPFIDQRNIFLMGLSQGGVTTALFSGESVRARIIEGWTCHAKMLSRDGLNAPRNEPVLSLLGARDHRLSKWRDISDDCGLRMYKDNGSKSFVFRDDLAIHHHLLAFPKVQAIVLGFLKKNMAQ